MVYGLLVVFHVIVCLFLIIVVLLQSGKAADLAGAFGGMGSQTAFGPRGSATILSKATTIAASVFMVTSMALAIMATQRSGAGVTVLEHGGGKATPLQQPQQRPAAPPVQQVPPPIPAPSGGSTSQPSSTPAPAKPAPSSTPAPATPAPAPAQK